MALLTDLENAGIPPSDVIFMCYGVNIVSDKEYGVYPDFTIFNGQLLLDKMLEIRSLNLSVPDCTEPTMMVFLSACGNRKY